MNNISDDLKSSVIMPEVAVPSVTVFGCGGAGINMVRKVSAHITDRKQADYRYIDTSYANLRYGEEAIITNTGEGSGLVRRHNVDEITQKISAASQEDLKLADVNIVVFSLSGGSGSVLGPILIREIARRGKLVIAITIASSQSQLHTDNTLKTLKSLEHMTKTKDIYLPITIFNNSIGLDLVDRGLPHKLERLVDILTLPTSELDKNDRLHWINAPKTIGATGGLRLLYVEAERTPDHDAVPMDAELWSGTSGYIFDSIVNIRTTKERHRLSSFCETRVSYEGVFTTVEDVPMIGIIGNPPNAFEKLTKSIEDTLTRYKAQSSKSHAAVEVSVNDIDDDSGLVL